MKKNLMSVLILALVVVNLILTAITMFTVMPAMKQSNALITQICNAIDLELEGGKTADASSIPIENLESYAIEGSFTINLKPGSDAKAHYVVLSASLVIDTTNEDYATYGTAEALGTKVDMIKSQINSVIAKYTMEEFQKANENNGVQQAITEALQSMYGSEFIVGVSFSGITYQ